MVQRKLLGPASGRVATTALWVSACLCAAPLRAEAPDAGAYLAARSAARANDFETAASYYDAVLAGTPGEAAMIERALSALVAAGDMEAAGALSASVAATETGGSQLTNMVDMARAAREGRWREVIGLLEAGRSVGPLVDGLAQGWALMGLGRTEEAIAQFDNLATKQGGMASFARLHEALALAEVGRFEEAEETLAAGNGAEGGRGILGRVEILSQLQRNDEAAALLKRAFAGISDPRISEMLNRLMEGERLPFDVVADPAAGLGEAFLGAATLLDGETEDRYTLLYSRMAEYLAPENADALMLSARLLEGMGRADLAAHCYDRLPEGHPASASVQLARAKGLRREGDNGAALDVLTRLEKQPGEVPGLQTVLGDTLREMGRMKPAEAAYSAALAQGGGPGQWLLHFSRGVTREKLGDWPGAEADFDAALEISPDQPQVLNYLGYALVEQGRDLSRALDMIERARKARPESGAITDSLGWALYHLGRTEEAVTHLEQAAALEPLDPVINDHLGDVYWRAGRRIEARFQWRRALGFGPEPETAERIRRKLALGLDRVLADEQDGPIKVAHDDTR